MDVFLIGVFHSRRGHKPRLEWLAGQLHRKYEGGVRMLATTLLNKIVRNEAGESLGTLEDFVVDRDTGNILYGIISFGGFLGGGDKLFTVPWSQLRIPASNGYVLVNVDRERLERAPAFDRNNWPALSDPAWRRRVDEYYGTVRPAPVVRERNVYVDRSSPSPRPRRGLSLLAGILILCLVLALGWMTFLVSTRGWDQAKQDIKSSLQGAAYAAKESTHDAALTTRVKTALSLSKRIPAGQIDVDSQGDVVTLRGEVPSQQVRDLAEQTTADVPGVREVHNHLFVVAGGQ